MGSVNTNFLPASTGLSLGSSNQKWNAYLSDVTSDTAEITTLNASDLIFTNANNIIYIGEGTDYDSLGDIGAEANAAYAALPPQGGTIVVVPRITSGVYGSYQFSTPIVFATLHKPVCFRGAGVAGSAVGLTGTILEFVPTSGSAVTLDYVDASGSGAVGHGIRDISIFNNRSFTPGGTGSGAIGIEIGASNGGAGYADFSNLNIQGFGTGFLNSPAVSGASWGCSFYNCVFAYNTTGYNSNTNGFEGISFFGTKFISNGTSALLVNGDTYFFGGSCDGFTTAGFNLNWSGVISAAYAEFHGVHMESTASGSQSFIIGNGNWRMFGGLIAIGKSTGSSTSYLTAGGGSCLVDGTELSSAGNTCTQVVNTITPVRASLKFVVSGSFPGPIFTPGYANATDTSFQANNTFVATGLIYEAPFNLNSTVKTYKGVATVANGVPAQVATVDLTAQSAAITATPFYTLPATGAGLYRISWVATVTTAASTSSTLGGTNGFRIIYTDADDSVGKTSPISAAPSAGVNQAYSQTNQGNTTGSQISGVIVAWAKASTALQYEMDYTTSGATAMQYNLHIRVEAL